MKRHLIALALVLGLAAPAAADDFTFALKLGVFEPNHDEKGLQYTGTGFAGELAFGWMPGKNFSLEMSAGVEEPGGSRGTSISLVPVLVSAKGILPLANDKLELFLGGGVGYYFSSGGGSGETTGAGYHVLLGADYRFTDLFSLGIELKRNFVEINSREVGGTTYELVGMWRF